MANVREMVKAQRRAVEAQTSLDPQSMVVGERTKYQILGIVLGLATICACSGVFAMTAN